MSWIHTLGVLCAVAVAAMAARPIGTRVAAIPGYRWEQFVGKVVLVTGGSSGIGYATALSFARYGARVVICSRDSNPAWFNGTAAAARINADPDVLSLGGYARWVRADVTKAKDVDALLADIVATEGTLDIAVNNAGIGGAFGALPDIEEYFCTEHDALQTNLLGQAQSLAAELQLFARQQRGGVIVNVASVNGFRGDEQGPLYVASKHASIGLTKSVALELARAPHHIRLNALAPGLTSTSLVWQQTKFLETGQQPWLGEYITPDHPLWKKWEPAFLSAIPAGRICDPMDQARMVMYLCSEEADYISGGVFVVDGGVNNNYA